jgi:uncharacterized protein (TIGR03118 family)
MSEAKHLQARSVEVKRGGGIAAIVCLALLVLAVAPSAALAKRPSNSYVVHPLVSDVATMAPVVDPNLVNGWGLAAGPTSPWWVSDNGTDKSTLYDGAGAVRSLVVDVAGAPTGIVFNASTGFPVTAGLLSLPARFIFATESGTILGWNPGIPFAGSTMSVVMVDRSTVGAVYKGLTIGAVGADPYLYATDFVNGRIDVFGADLSLKSWAGAFVDKRLPKGYGPFGIQAIGDRLFVTYAKQNPPSHDELAGQGLGIVDEYDMSGTLLARVATHGQLNAPWGVAMAPVSGFGRCSGCLLVGNFGDGHIDTFAMNRHGRWVPRGALRTVRGKKLSIDGLWGIAFGHGAETASGPSTTLYFAAGPNDEAHGLFGSVTTP